MEKDKNMEQAATNAAVPTVKKNGNSRRESGVKEIYAIRTFLESAGIYEADALRVSIAIADGRITTDNISADDRLALNRYLNSGENNERLTAENAQEHRISRVFGLLERATDFCDKRQLVTVNRMLLSIAVNPTDISRAVSSLDRRSATGQIFQGSTSSNGAGK